MTVIAFLRSCTICGCTDDDCSQCVAASGFPCSWVENETMCSRCVNEAAAAQIRPHPLASTIALYAVLLFGGLCWGVVLTKLVKLVKLVI